MGNVGLCVQVASATQELVLNGWIFVTSDKDGKEEIKEAHNVFEGLLVEFDTDEDFTDWLLDKAKKLRDENRGLSGRGTSGSDS